MTRGSVTHLGIDRRHGFIRSFTVTDAAARDGRQLGAPLDPHNTASPVWADSAYRSAANVALLVRRGLVPQVRRPKPRGKPMPPHIVRGNAGRARVRVAIEHVFAAQKCRLSLVIRSVGLARAKSKLGLANLVTNMRRPRLVRDAGASGLSSGSAIPGARLRRTRSGHRPQPPTAAPARLPAPSDRPLKTGASRCP